MSNINYNFNKLTPFKFFCLTNFPFIEEDFDALTYYQLLCKVVEYLNKVITSTNSIGTQTEELTNAFNTLEDYVNNYFTNLDVQEEINNKLDKMATDGTLDKIINQEIFGELNDKITNLENDINDIENNQTTIFMSDSYGEGQSVPSWVTGWPTYAKQALNIPDNQYYNFSESGAGFLNRGGKGHTFLTLLQSKLNQVTDKSKVKRFVLCGGGNDARYYVDHNYKTTSQMDTAIKTFVNYAKEQFPNAKIYFGMITNLASTYEQSQRDYNARNKFPIIIRAYKNAIKLNVGYLSGVENIMKNYSYFSGDLVHPTQDGYIKLGYEIAQAIKTGCVQYKDIYVKDNFTPAEFINTDTSFFDSNSSLLNDTVDWGIVNAQFFLSTPQTYGESTQTKKEIKLGDILPNYYRAGYINQCRIITNGFYRESDGTVYAGAFELYINENMELILNTPVLKSGENLYHTPTNVTEIFFNPGHACIPSIYC